jgi:hypothetical protein
MAPPAEQVTPVQLQGAELLSQPVYLLAEENAAQFSTAFLSWSRVVAA